MNMKAIYIDNPLNKISSDRKQVTGPTPRYDDNDFAFSFTKDVEGDVYRQEKENLEDILGPFLLWGHVIGVSWGLSPSTTLRSVGLASASPNSMKAMLGYDLYLHRVLCICSVLAMPIFQIVDVNLVVRSDKLLQLGAVGYVADIVTYAVLLFLSSSKARSTALFDRLFSGLHFNQKMISAVTNTGIPVDIAPRCLYHLHATVRKVVWFFFLLGVWQCGLNQIAVYGNPDEVPLTSAAVFLQIVRTIVLVYKQLIGSYVYLLLALVCCFRFSSVTYIFQAMYFHFSQTYCDTDSKGKSGTSNGSNKEGGVKEGGINVSFFRVISTFFVREVRALHFVSRSVSPLYILTVFSFSFFAVQSAAMAVASYRSATVGGNSAMWSELIYELTWIFTNAGVLVSMKYCRFFPRLTGLFAESDIHMKEIHSVFPYFEIINANDRDPKFEIFGVEITASFLLKLTYLFLSIVVYLMTTDTLSHL